MARSAARLLFRTILSSGRREPERREDVSDTFLVSERRDVQTARLYALASATLHNLRYSLK